MVFLSYLQSDINLVYIRDLKIECRARPLTRRGKEEGFHVEIESPCDLDEEAELYPAADPLSSRGINKFLRESEQFQAILSYQSDYQCYNYRSMNQTQSESKASKDQETTRTVHTADMNDNDINNTENSCCIGNYKVRKAERIHRNKTPVNQL